MERSNITGNYQKSAQNTADALRNGIDHAADRAHSAAKDTINTVANKVDDFHDQAKPMINDAVRRGERALHNAGEKVSEWTDKAKTRASRMTERCESYVSEQPIKSVMIAAGVGAVVAALLMTARSRRQRYY